MASSDSTGFHDVGWKFHQYSSSGGVLVGSSESVLQLNSGSVIEGVVTAGSSTVIRKLKMNTITTTGPNIMVEGKNTLLMTAGGSDYIIELPTPFRGNKVEVTVFGGSSNIVTIQTADTGIALNKNLATGDTSFFGIVHDSDPVVGGAAAAGNSMGANYVFESTGTAGWVVTMRSPSIATMSTAVPV